jgi:hypothetical protein
LPGEGAYAKIQALYPYTEFAAMRVDFLIAASLLLASSLFVYACGGCPSGTREYLGECIPEKSDDTPINPYLPPDVPDGDMEIILPEPTEPPRDYNSVPTSDPIDTSSMEAVPIDLGDIDPESGSMIVWVEGNVGNYVLPYSIKTPEGDSLYSISSDLDDGNINDESFFHYYPDSSLSIFLPNTPLISFASTDWSISVTSLFEGNSYDVQIFPKPLRPENKPNNRLGVNVWFVGIDGLDDDGNETAQFSKAMSVFQQLYADAGIALSPVVYVDVTEEEKQRFGVVDSMDEYYNMMMLSGRLDNNYPNLFLIKGFSAMPGVLGMAAHIPGPPGVQGDRFSGVGVSMEYFDAYPRTMGLVMAHELGHWLGLFHPTEAMGMFFDAIPDTDTCPAASHDHNGDSLVDQEECSGHGAENLMFWLVPYTDDFPVGPNGVHLSQQQAQVLHLNPIVEYVE